MIQKIPHSFGPDGFAEPGIDAQTQSSDLLHVTFLNFLGCLNGMFLKAPSRMCLCVVDRPCFF